MVDSSNRLGRAILVCAAATALLFSSSTAMANCLSDKELRGVNLAGAEFNSAKKPGVFEKDYTYPNQTDVDQVKELGGNVIRLPFLWERIQPDVRGELVGAEVARIDKVVRMARAQDICVVLDVHNYGTHNSVKIGSETLPAEAFDDLWLKLAKHFDDPRETIFGLMNEPAKLPIDVWAKVAQGTVVALRDAGSKNIILVPGGRWSGVHEWFRTIGATSNADAFANLKDPARRTWLEAHQYADTNFSGTKQECVDPARFPAMFGRLSEWAKKNDQKLFLGEFGVPPNEQCMRGLEEMLSQMNDNPVWRGWAYWAAGRWWGNYPMSIQSRDGQEKPQVAILRQYISGRR